MRAPRASARRRGVRAPPVLLLVWKRDPARRGDARPRGLTGCPAVVVVRAPQPDRRRRDRRRPVRARRPRRDRPSVCRVRRARSVAARPRAPEHRRRPHLLEGVRAGRCADRLHPRAARDRPPARRDPSAGVDLVVLGRPRRDRDPRGRRDARPRCRDRRRARPHGDGAPLGRARRPGLVRELPPRRPRRGGGSGLEAAARAGPGGAHLRRSAARDPYPGQPGDAGRRRRAPGGARAGGRAPSRRPRRGSAPPSAARPRPTSAAASRSTAPDGRRWRRGSACSTTC